MNEVDGKGVVKGCKSVTFVDRSEGMVEVARRKFEEMYPKDSRERSLARFMAQDAMADIPPPTTSTTSARKGKGGNEPAYKFDTVLQTMGLCSHSDPVSLLKHLSTIAEPEKGQILLLEHGRSHYEWLNRILDGLAAAHADKHGCWWNRDIGDVVERRGLEVVERKRWYLGTTWGFVLRPPADGDKKGGGER